jgi:hypothetical protein
VEARADEQVDADGGNREGAPSGGLLQAVELWMSCRRLSSRVTSTSVNNAVKTTAAAFCPVTADQMVARNRPIEVTVSRIGTAAVAGAVGSTPIRWRK